MFTHSTKETGHQKEQWGWGLEVTGKWWGWWTKFEKEGVGNMGSGVVFIKKGG